MVSSFADMLVLASRAPATASPARPCTRYTVHAVGGAAHPHEPGLAAAGAAGGGDADAAAEITRGAMSQPTVVLVRPGRDVVRCGDVVCCGGTWFAAEGRGLLRRDEIGRACDLMR